MVAGKPGGTLIAIPMSPEDFLVFYDANDMAEYMKGRFATRDGHLELAVSEAWDDPLVTLTKQP